ncbi:MAG TPA: hypothetical protein VLK34_02305 [Nocardioidaceae bacterium]|nr:hypothetical protein [Nocardioidaceae bacterium]
MPSRDDGPLDLAAARSRVYGVKPAEFVSVRGDLAKQARSAGDKDLAGQIQSLRKPTLAAWLVNALAREGSDALAELLDLGREMREEMGAVDADGLRELTRRRHQLVSALVDQARELGAASGLRVADEAARSVRATLEATLSDGDSSAEVAEGCLSEPLEPTGFGFGFGLGGDSQPTRLGVAASDGSSATVTDIAPSSATVTDIADRRARKEVEIADAEQGLADAEALTAQAGRARADAQRDAAAADRSADKASDKIDKLEARLRDARAELAEQHQAASAAHQAVSDAEKAVRAAARALAAATERLRRLRR